MDEMNNQISEQENQNLEKQEGTTPEDTNASEPSLSSAAPKKPTSKKTIIGGLIAIVAIVLIASVVIMGFGRSPSGSTTTTTTTTTQTPPAGSDLAFLEGFEDYGYTADQISEMSEILTNVGVTSVKDLVVEEISADTRIARGVCTKAEAVELMSARSLEEVVYVEFEIYKGVIIRITIIAEEGEAGLDGLNALGVSLYDKDKGGYLNIIDWEKESVEDYPESEGNEHIHIEEIDSAVEATCKVTGLTEGKHCSVCGKTLVVQEVVPVVAHTYDDEFDADCNVCGDVRDAACAHAETEVIPGKEATCEKTGLTEGKKCKKCGTVIVEQNEIPMVAHTYDDKYDEKCNVCGYERDAECAHSETEVIPGKEPTCTATGFTDGTKCKKCGEILTAQTSIPVKDHKYTSAITEPTCSEKGYTTHTCSVCGDSYKDTYTDTVAHTMGDWYVYAVPTFYEKGEERKSCANCDHYESREIATVGSEYTDPAIIVQNVTVNQGAEEVVLEVYIKNIPGIIAMTLQMNVDDNAFALQSAKKGDTLPSTDLTVGKQTSSPYRFLFDAMEVTEEDKKDGVLLTITLNVKDPSALAKGEYNVTFSYTDGDIYDENFNTIDLQMVSGTITVK